MKLPHLENAFVPEAKIVKYLLNLEHKQGGKDKAIYFMRFGFTIEAWEVLAQALLAHAEAYEVTSTSEKPEVTNSITPLKVRLIHQMSVNHVSALCGHLKREAMHRVL